MTAAESKQRSHPSLRKFQLGVAILTPTGLMVALVSNGVSIQRTSEGYLELILSIAILAFPFLLYYFLIRNRFLAGIGGLVLLVWTSGVILALVSNERSTVGIGFLGAMFVNWLMVFALGVLQFLLLVGKSRRPSMAQRGENGKSTDVTP